MSTFEAFPFPFFFFFFFFYHTVTIPNLFFCFRFLDQIRYLDCRKIKIILRRQWRIFKNSKHPSFIPSGIILKVHFSCKASINPEYPKPVLAVAVLLHIFVNRILLVGVTITCLGKQTMEY